MVCVLARFGRIIIIELKVFFSPHSSLKEVRRNNDVGVCFNFNCEFSGFELKLKRRFLSWKNRPDVVVTIGKSKFAGFGASWRWNLAWIDVGTHGILDRDEIL